ncbi:hypothetical protein D9757_007700 [Collybiopsis confluens]|uniref:Uncharacterized protein n=1 Tax=Collybiopsis confluens TaxID=2823264 RepID=A0A8H5M153_9AGAR|nr:hypothetical protein D9757_007700 [Collybiopsis confluens]
MLFGDPGIPKGSSPVKYGSKSKSIRNSPVKIDIPDASSSSRKRALATSDESDDIEILDSSPLTPLSPALPLKSSAVKASKATVEESWSIQGLGDFVWVRMNQTGRVFNVETDNKNEFMWWPAKSNGIVKGELSVSPYGSLASPQSSIRVQNTGPENTLSLTDRHGRPRFDTFSSARHPASVLSSPRKKAKRAVSDIKTNWQAAVGEILREKEDQDDGLPPIEFALSAASRLSKRKDKGKGQMKSKIKLPSPDELEIDELESDEELPEPDELLQIPGELVLARDKAEKNVSHWPAKLLAFVAPSPNSSGNPRSKEPKYRIVFLDDTKKEVPRSWFYACHDLEFGTCQIGKFESQYMDNPEEDEDDGVADSSPRSPSPAPLSSLSGAFTDLSIRAQLGYIKPVLSAILKEQYPPAKDRHGSFMKGGKARAGLGTLAGLRGTIPPGDIDKLQKHLSHWCLREELRASNTEEILALNPTDPLVVGADTTNVNIVPNGGIPSKEFVPQNPATDLRSSPTLTEVGSPPSPRPTLPPSSSALSILSQISVEEGQLESKPLESGRQKGCPAYEALTGVEKITYCLNVLLPEAVLQLLLWRNRHRTSVELLSDTAEADLHATAERLARETDWVFDVVRLREVKVRQMNSKKGQQAGLKMAGPSGHNGNGRGAGGRSSRPRRSFGKY